MQLRCNHEIVGVVRDIIIDKDEVRIIFAIDTEIELAKSDTPKEITREIINQRIGIINIDNKYSFRRI